MSDEESMFRQPTGGGKFIKLEEYADTLVLFKPESVNQVPAYKPTEPDVDEVTALWVAFGPKGVDEVEGAKFKGGALVRAAKEALKPDSRFPWVLGVLQKVPTSDTKKKFKIEGTPEAFKECRERWLRDGAPGEGPRHAWVLGTFTDAQAATAAKYVEAHNKTANPFVKGSAQ